MIDASTIIIVFLYMGNDLTKCCGGNDNTIDGFGDKKVIEKTSEKMLIPQRSQIVQQTYLKLCKQKIETFINSVENKKQFIEPIELQIYGQRAVYVGYEKNGRPHGPGQIFFGNSNYLEGIYKQGQIDCRDGIFIQANGNYYRGGFVASQQSGQGLYCKNNDIIKGTFDSGVLNGKGQLIGNDGRYYQGNFKDSRMDGKGVMTYPNGQVYQGFFKDSKRSGIGKLKTNKYEYHGPYKDDMKCGKGTLIMNDGSKFQGWFQEDRMKGYGAWHRPDGTRQAGQFDKELIF